MPDQGDLTRGAVASWLTDHLEGSDAVEGAQAETRPPPPIEPAGAGARVGCALLEVVLVLAGLGVGWVVWWAALWHQGRSPARVVLHLELVRLADGSEPGWRTTASRELLAKVLLPLAPLSALLWLRGRRGLWDRASGTVVVRTPVGA